MKAIIFSVLFIITSLISSAQSDDNSKSDTIIYNKVAPQTYDGSEFLIGKCTYDGLLSFEAFSKYYHYYFENYEPKLDSLNQYHEKIQQLHIKIVLGTWCSDSQEQLAHFFRIMEDLGYPPHQFELIAVDENKLADSLDISDLEIKRVPTIIFYYQDKEIGRIIETPEETIEKDLEKIIEKIEG